MAITEITLLNVTVHARGIIWKKLNVKSGTSTFSFSLPFIVLCNYFSLSLSFYFFFLFLFLPLALPLPARNEFLAAHEYPSANHNEESSVRDNLKRIIQSLARFYPGGEACGGLLACEYVNESFLFSSFLFFPSLEIIFSGNGRISTGGIIFT